MTKRRFIVLTGPTACGKTAVSIALAKALGSPIISADSMQIYRGCDIGTAKITTEQADGVAHHLIDIVDPSDAYSVADYQRDAFLLIEKYNAKGIVPIVVGGTGLYINSLVYQLRFGSTCPDMRIRQKYTQLADDKSTQYLYNELIQKDPEYAKMIASGDKRRIIRRLELIETGGAEKYDFRQPNTDDVFVQIGLKLSREVLYRRIEERVDQMMALGLEQEARVLFEKYGEVNATKAIGYKEFCAYFAGEADMAQTAALIKRNTRRYAKRQMTWFARDARIKWFDVLRYPCLKDLSDDIIAYVNRKGF